MSDLAVREHRTVLCGQPVTMLRDSDGAVLDLCSHHTDESPCPHHPADAGPQDFLVDFSGESQEERIRRAFYEEDVFVRNLFNGGPFMTGTTWNASWPGP